MRYHRQELTLQNALSDPLVRTAMVADGVDPQELRAMLTAIASTLGQAQRQGNASRCGTNCA